ncbi:MAG: O-antigen ligase family protein [Nitrospirae bacterium]|nr:O-antigen ligase family protein [Nitrospirota bacterium]
MNSEKLNKLYIAGIKIVIFLIAFTPLYTSMSFIFPYIEGKNYVFRILLEIAAVLWCGLIALNKEYRPKNTPVFLAILIFTFIAGLADLFGVNPFKSFWSSYERMEGYLTILHLTLYFAIIKSVLSTRKDWTLFLNVVFFASLCVSSYALFHELLKGGELREYSTIGHPSFLAAYMLVAVFIGLKLFFTTSSFRLRCFYAASILLNTSAIYYSATRGAFLGLFFGALLFSSFYAFGKPKTSQERLYRGIALSVIAASILVPIMILFFYKAPPLPPGSEFHSLLPRFATATIDLSLHSRFEAWKVAWAGIKERPILGWGQENFISLYTVSPIPYGGKSFLDRAHNIFLEWLVNAGISGLLSYLLIFGAAIHLIRAAYKNGTVAKIEAATLITALGVYLVQNLSVFDTINSYLIFFSLLAYIDNLHDPGKATSRDDINLNRRRIKSLCAAFLALFVFLSAAYFIHYKPMRESYLTNRMIFDFKENKYKSFLPLLHDFKKALSLDTFGNTEIRRLMSSISSGILGIKAFGIEGALEFIKASAEEAKKFIEEDFYNLEYRMEVVDLYHAVAAYEPSFISKAEALIKESMSISPENTWNYFALADNYILKKDYENAFLSVKKGVDIDPRNDDVQAKLAVAGIMTSRNDITNEALENVRKIRTSRDRSVASGEKYFLKIDELLVCAQAAIEVKDYKNALQFYDKILKISPGSAQYHFDAAELYLALGDRNNARKEAEKALELDPVNFKKKVKEIID